MSVCLESTVLQKPVNNGAESTLQQLDSSTSSCTSTPNKEEEPNFPQKNLAKLVLTTIAPTTNPSLLQRVANNPVITVVNTTGPLTILKTVVSNPGASLAPPQFSLVNSTPLAVGKPITVVTAPPITVVKAIPNVSNNNNNNPAATQQIIDENSKGPDILTSSSSGLLNSLTDRPPLHNVFVKNTTLIPELVTATDTELEKITTTTLHQPHIIKAVPVGSVPKSLNGQINEAVEPSNKIKIVGNCVSPTSVITSASSNPSNIILNKSLNSKAYLQQKMINNSSLNGSQKIINKSLSIPNNISKPGSINKHNIPNKSQKLMYPTHKSQIRTMPQMNNNLVKSGIKTLPPQTRGIPSQQVQRSGMGLRTIPPQRPKVANKPNYIGKHAIQAQKFRSPHGIGKLKSVKPPVPSNNLFPHRTPQNTGVTYHQALTANIIQSLTENTPSRPYDFATRYDSFNEVRPPTNYSDAYNIPAAPNTKPQSNLEALSFVCQAVLLDHNYNATPPSENLNRTVPSTTASLQLNGGNSVSSYYSPPNSTNFASTRKRAPCDTGELCETGRNQINHDRPRTKTLLTIKKSTEYIAYIYIFIIKSFKSGILTLIFMKREDEHNDY